MTLNQCNQDVYYERNREHYLEWINISDANIRKQNGQNPLKRTDEEKEKLIKHMAEIRHEIHFHTFNKNNFKEALSYFCENINNAMNLLIIKNNFSEYIAILRKD